MNINTGRRELRMNWNKVIVFTRDMVKKIFNIPSRNKTIELYKRHEEFDIRNIYHKNGRARIAHTLDVLHTAINDDGDTAKRYWVLLAHATVLTPSMGNMMHLECLKSLEEMDKVTQFAWEEHVLRVARNEFQSLSDTPYATLSQEGAVKGVTVGNKSVAAQDVLNCDDTQDCWTEVVNINENQDDVGAKDNPIEDSNQVENGKSAQEDVCGSLDDWL
ncbi:hypothetical protein D1007_09646 [Hordeum vulgare]|nr:hypothetical protein D1007_09646 [Hordeum vulgare]